jgi:signal peptidase
MLSATLPLGRRAFGILLAAVALILALALAVLVPALLGYQRYVITSGSMTGTYDRGSLVFDRVVPTTSLRAGEHHHLPPAWARRSRDAPHRVGAHGPRPARVHHQG